MARTIVRRATENDAEDILEIYAPYVRKTCISFEMDTPTIAEMKDRIARVSMLYPWLVCETSSRVSGYAYASKHRERAAYQWSVDVSIYLADEYHGMGIGTRLYTALFMLLRDQGFYNAYAGITLPNPASIALHQKMGFKKIGVYQNVGFKNDAWHDVGWWGLRLNTTDVSPVPPKAISMLLKENSSKIASLYGLTS
jgi:phosphinothricin acetyltransferase